MRIKLSHVTPLLGAAAIGAAISAAPIASADPGTQTPAQQSCTGSGAGTICQSPGNIQINDAPPPAQLYPYGG